MTSPHPLRRGGKRGSWVVNPDGSGTWTREDKSAVRYRTLYKSGPSKSEVHTRVTFDGVTGDQLDVTERFDTCKVIDAEVPPPTPRALKTVFHFDRTAATIPPDATVVGDPQSVPPQPVGTNIASVSVRLTAGSRRMRSFSW